MGEGEETRTEGLRQGPDQVCGCPPCAPSAAPQLGASARGRGATNSRAWRSSPFFAADPGKGGRLGGGTAKGGGDSLPRALGGLAPLPAGSSGGAEAQRRAPARAESRERIGRVGHCGEEGRTGPPRRTDAPGGALAPEGVSRPQIEQLGNRRAERGRAGRPGQFRGGRVSRPRPRPSRACPRRGWQRGGESPRSCPVLLPSSPFHWDLGRRGPSHLGLTELSAGGGGRGDRQSKGTYDCCRVSEGGGGHLLESLLRILPSPPPASLKPVGSLLAVLPRAALNPAAPGDRAHSKF